MAATTSSTSSSDPSPGPEPEPESKPNRSSRKRRTEPVDNPEEELVLGSAPADAEDGDDGDSEDSEDSVYSGLEDSGSDSDDSDPESGDEDRPEETCKDEGDVALDTEVQTEKNLEPQKDEYEQDSSDEEDIRNTVGNIPMEWYADFPHIGYDLDGKKILKPIRTKDELDQFLNKMEDPDFWKTVQDKQTGQDMVLTEQQVALVNRLQKGQFGDVNFNEHEPSVDFFTHEVMIHPVTNRPSDKRSFIPSLIEKEKVSKLVHAIKMGWIKPRRTQDDSRGRYYDLWASEEQGKTRDMRMHVPAPRAALPGHEESYNPPPEYLMTDEERAVWEQQDPIDRKLPFVPRKFSCLRHVPAFERFIHERFDRCLDLYLCPRQRKMRVNVNPEDLIPKLPRPRDLQPFPTTQAMVMTYPHVSPVGFWSLFWGDDGTARFWEVSSGRCLKKVEVGGAIKSAVWNPNHNLSLVALSVGSVVLLVSPPSTAADKQVVTATERLLSDEVEPAAGEGPVVWSNAEGEELHQGIRMKIQHPKPVTQVTWHSKGDYLAAVMPDHSSHLQVLIHQVSKRRSQNPFSKNKGLVQSVAFHPIRPYFLLATQRSVRIYNLLKQELSKKLQGNAKWISSLAVHPAGDNVICGSYDCRLSWFDLDLSTKPYKTLRHHRKAVRSVAFHRSYPLFASASDDGSVIVCHGTVFSDLLQNPLIVPVKVLKGHVITHDLGVLDVTFHPSQPWVFSSGADGTIRLFT
uniref:Ribosome biogenesis protein BOP1 n=1 Tax=Neogobius melanostomus TaxID=47308 RepID=A0A8C6TZS7_9GOBI